jgi:hypothetical protein
MEIELAGFDGFHDGKGMGDSPWPAGSDEDAAWRSGWFTAYTVSVYRLRPWPLGDIMIQ